MHLEVDDSLPVDRDKATLVGRAWVVHPCGGAGGHRHSRR